MVAGICMYAVFAVILMASVALALDNVTLQECARPALQSFAICGRSWLTFWETSQYTWPGPGVYTWVPDGLGGRIGIKWDLYAPRTSAPNPPGLRLRRIFSRWWRGHPYGNPFDQWIETQAGSGDLLENEIEGLQNASTMRWAFSPYYCYYYNCRKGPGYYQKLEFELDFGEYKGTTAGAARDGETFQGTYMGFSDFYSGPTMWTHIHFYPERSKTGNFSGWRFIKAGAGHRTSRVTQSIPTNAVTFNFNTGRLNALYQAAEGGTAVGIGSTSGMLRMPGDRGYRIMRFMIETTWGKNRRASADLIGFFVTTQDYQGCTLYSCPTPFTPMISGKVCPSAQALNGTNSTTNFTLVGSIAQCTSICYLDPMCNYVSYDTASLRCITYSTCIGLENATSPTTTGIYGNTTEINECDTGAHNCFPGAVCQNTIGSFECSVCPNNLHGNGVTCVTDMNECILGTHGCPNISYCVNTQGSFECHCNGGPGYILLPNDTCVDWDECNSTSTYKCFEGSNCTNTIGSYKCTCPTWADICVEPEENLVGIVANATANTTILVMPGTHNLTEPIVIGKNLTIVGIPPNRTIIHTTYPYIFVTNITGQPYAIGDLCVDYPTSTDICCLNTPYALIANFTMDLVQPTIINGKLNIEADLGPWFYTRYVTEVFFANCSYSQDGPTNVLSPKLSDYYFAIYSRTCRASVWFKVGFNKFGNCGMTIERHPNATTAKFNNYLADIECEMREWVTRITDIKDLWIPRWRDANAMAKIMLQISRVGTVSAAITVNYPYADLRAAITVLGIRVVDNINTSTVAITITMPAPYTLTGGQSGNLLLSNMKVPSANASQWVIGSGPCNNLPINGTCAMILTFNITACDLTGQYIAQNVQLGCQASSSAAGLCPAIVSSTANIQFFISTNDFCAIKEINLSNAFVLDLLLRKDLSYLENRPNTTFRLGSPSYWSMRVWTNVTGVGVSDAQIVEFSRTSDGNCAKYPIAPFAGAAISTMSQIFVSSRTPPEVQSILPVMPSLACAMLGAKSNNVSLTWTVRVDYIDQTRRRRRRQADLSFTDDNPKYQLNGAIDILPEGTEPPTTVEGGDTDQEAMSDTRGSTKAIAAVIAVDITVLLCCCCGVCVAFTVVRRRRRNKQEVKIQENSFVASSDMSFNYPSSASTNKL